MSQFERLFKLKSHLDAGRCLSRSFLLEDLGIGPSSLKRDIAHLRDRMGAPIVFDRERGGWRLDKQNNRVGAQYELPGLWLTAEEMHALLSIQHLLVMDISRHVPEVQVLEPQGLRELVRKKLRQALDQG